MLSKQAQLEKNWSKTMNNADMPAMPHDIVFGKGYPLNYDSTGLTKRERACLIMGVADTGDAELDAIITKGNKNKLAGLAMQSLLTHYGTDGADECASYAVEYADALLEALEPDND
tara:strand:- start:379 stop:726 length:348 start_codon:yes stop_codon:yes gene_type:complete